MDVLHPARGAKLFAVTLCDTVGNCYRDRSVVCCWALIGDVGLLRFRYSRFFTVVMMLNRDGMLNTEGPDPARHAGGGTDAWRQF